MISANGTLPGCWSAALVYAEKGQPVIPIYEPSGSGCSCVRGVSCEHAAKHPRWDPALFPNGVDSATTDTETIRRMAAMWPQANIAVRCDGLVVIDVDGDEGRDGLTALFEPHGGLPPTIVQQTARGRHVFFRSSDADSFVSRAGFRPGLDLRAGRRAYIMVAPSRHVTGKLYQLVDRDAKLLELPGWLAEILPRREPRSSEAPADSPPRAIVGRTAYGKRALEGIALELHSTPVGERNQALNRLAFRAGQLVGAGHLLEDEAHSTIGQAATAIGLGAREIQRTWESGFRAGLVNPDPDLPAPGDGVQRALDPSRRHRKEWILMNASIPEESAAGGDDRRPWPDPLRPAALHGLAGDVVRFIDPETESDPAAVLVQFLVAIGNVIGRSAHWRVEAHRHALNLFAVLVGQTSRGRKGTSLRHVRALVCDADPEWERDNIKSGLSSGEGLIYHVRDELDEWDAKKEQTVVIDPGVSDKRLLVIEDEFAQPLKVMQREGNTLSPVLRRAWDGDQLSTLTRNQPLRATDAHISMIGHITREEALRLITATDVANGFANRFLWVCVRRSKHLPRGGQFEGKDRTRLVARIQDVVRFAQRLNEIGMTKTASARWEQVYEDLTADCSGLLGSATSRGEAQVMKISSLYALLDLRGEIDLPHLEAGLEVWRYCAHSARYLFGNRLGDPVADRIAEALRENRSGLTLTDINALFSGHVPGPRITASLEALRDQGLARPQQFESGGRPITRWVVVDLFPHIPLFPQTDVPSSPAELPGDPIAGSAEKAEKAEKLGGVLRI